MHPSERSEPSDRGQPRSRVQRRSTQTPPAGQQRITFVDSRDPNIRSTIQRHTAHHTNQQRRDARLQSLRSNARPRILEWQRRIPSNDHSNASTPTTATTSSTSSPASASMIGQSHGPVLGSQSTPMPDDYRSSLVELVGHWTNDDQDEEALRQSLLNFACPHTPHPDAMRNVVQFAQADRASAILLCSYATCLRVVLSQSSNPEYDRNRAIVYLVRGTALLMNRLDDSQHACSNENIQAVLLLIAITTDFDDFGNPGESTLHRAALRTMLAERGGVDTLPPILREQAQSVDIARTHHLTLGCGPDCTSTFRFPSGDDEP